jgi:hypothetical protein
MLAANAARRVAVDDIPAVTGNRHHGIRARPNRRTA